MVVTLVTLVFLVVLFLMVFVVVVVVVVVVVINAGGLEDQRWLISLGSCTPNSSH